MGCASMEIMAEGERQTCKSTEGRAELQSLRASAGRDSLFPVQYLIWEIRKFTVIERV